MVTLKRKMTNELKYQKKYNILLKILFTFVLLPFYFVIYHDFLIAKTLTYIALIATTIYIYTHTWS